MRGRQAAEEGGAAAARWAGWQAVAGGEREDGESGRVCVSSYVITCSLCASRGGCRQLPRAESKVLEAAAIPSGAS